MRRADMGARKESKDAADRLGSILENLEGTPAEDLRSILLNLDPEAGAREQEFMTHLRTLRAGLGRAEAGEASAAPADAPLKGLISEARRRGLTASGLADAAGLSPTLLKMLDMRLARFGTIPAAVVEDLAAALRRGFGEVASYLRAGPALTASAYQAGDRGEAPPVGQQDFMELVRADRNISEERRARLLGTGDGEGEGL